MEMELSLRNTSPNPTNTNPLHKTEILTKFKLIASNFSLKQGKRKEKNAMEGYEEKGEKKKIPRSRTLEMFHSSACSNTKTRNLEAFIRWVFEINKKKPNKHKTRNIEFPTCWDDKRLYF